MATTQTLIQVDGNVRTFLSSPKKLLIDGKWVSALSGKTFATP